MSRLRIISDGTPQGTEVFCSNGEPIRGVHVISWHLDAHEPMAVVTMKVIGVEVDMAGEYVLTEVEDGGDG